MIYNDNSCSNCGGVRVAGSTLCGDCLAVFYGKLKVGMEDIVNAVEIETTKTTAIIKRKNGEIENLKYQLKLHKKIVSHIFREYQIVRGLKAVDILA